MADDLSRVDPPRDARPPMLAGPTDFLAAFLSGRKPTTIRAYQWDVGDFARFLGAGRPDAAVELLLGLSHGEANGLALAYRNAMVEKGLAPATINRRLAALR